MKRFLTAMSICVLLVMPGVVKAQTHLWDGSTDNDWDRAANWTLSGGADSWPGHAAGATYPNDTVLIDLLANDGHTAEHDHEN